MFMKIIIFFIKNDWRIRSFKYPEILSQLYCKKIRIDAIIWELGIKQLLAVYFKNNGWFLRKKLLFKDEIGRYKIDSNDYFEARIQKVVRVIINPTRTVRGFNWLIFWGEVWYQQIFCVNSFLSEKERSVCPLDIKWNWLDDAII